MQVNTSDTHATKRIIINLVERALHQYKQSIRNLDEEASPDVHKSHLLLQLKALLGEVLVDALRLLDEQNIQLYAHEGSEIAEIQIRQQQYKRSIWLFPHINYCTCKQFKEFVLGLQDKQIPPPTTTSSTPTNEVHYEHNRKYTCAHVLALRLAQLLRPTPPTFKVEKVTKQQIKNLHNRMYSNYLDLFREHLD